MKASKSVTALCAIVVSAACTSAAFAESVTFSRIAGSVRVEVAGAPVAVRNGSVLETPIRIVTGADGALHIEQSSSALDIGPDSVIVVPGTSSKSGAEKILQELGRVLYSVKPRKSGSFVVETPYLVSVVKGTTFSVAIDQSSTAVTLLEGLVEVSGPGTDDRAVLQPNQRAVRALGERSISVSIVDTTAAVSAPRVPTHSAPAPVTTDSSDETLSLQANRVADDLGQITAAYVDTRSPSNAPEIEAPAPPPDLTPSTPIVPVPDIAPAPQPAPTPMPIPDSEDDEDDDGNNGHGDEDDDDDDSNPAARP